MKAEWEALSDQERREKARRLREDVELLENPPEGVKDDVAALCNEDNYEDAVEYLDRPWYNRE